MHVSGTFKSIFVDFYKVMRTECLKIGLNHTVNFVPVKYMTHKLCRPFRSELNPKLTNFWCYMNTHMLNICIISKNGACFQYLQPIAADFYKAMRTKCLKIGINHTLNFVRIKYMTHKLCRPFRSELNPKLKQLSYQMNIQILNISIIFKKCPCLQFV